VITAHRTFFVCVQSFKIINNQLRKNCSNVKTTQNGSKRETAPSLQTGVIFRSSQFVKTLPFMENECSSRTHKSLSFEQPHSDRVCLFNTLMAVVFKLEILTKTKVDKIICSLKCIYDLTAHRGQQHANSRRSVQCTEDDNEGLTKTKR